MKRKLMICAMALCICAGLTGNTGEVSVWASEGSSSDAVRIGALKGPTAMGMAQLLDEDGYDFTIAASPDEIVPMVVQDKLDIAAVPANLAATLYQKTDKANAENVRGEVVFAQAMLETGWLSFGGDAGIDQFNFAGLGTTGGGVKGIAFPDVRTGIRAQVQHLKAYASTDSLNQECVDERFDYVTRETAPYVEWLGIQENPYGGGWAAGKDYGSKLRKILADLKSGT